MEKEILMSFVAAAMMASCSSDEELSNSGEKFNGNVTLTAEPYTFGDGDTRTTLSNTGSKIAFAWDDDETIGIFPIAPTTNIQAKQVLKNGSGNGTTSSFDGAGWALMYGNTYAAYYPFNSEMKLESTYKEVPIDMTGQTQNGNNSLAHIGASYDYMYATTSVPTKGNVNFDFKHVTSILVLELTLPVEAKWTNVTLSCKDPVFTTKATMNTCTGEISPIEKSKIISLKLNNIKSPSQNEIKTLYLAVLPAETEEITIDVTTSDNNHYTSILAPKNFASGKAYRYTTTLEFSHQLYANGIENGHEYVDLGLPSGTKWATTNIGATVPAEYGNYYAWGEIKTVFEEDESNEHNYYYNIKNGLNTFKKTVYNYSTYKFSYLGTVSYYPTYSKYISHPDMGKVDNKTRLEPEDDAAAQNWGGTWHMPTYEEMQELCQNCYFVLTDRYDNKELAHGGYIVFKAKNDSDKGVCVLEKNISKNYTISDPHIFLPSTGMFRNDKVYYDTYNTTHYWSSYTDGDDFAPNCFYIGVYNTRPYFKIGTLYRETGCAIRAVCD